MSMSLLIYLTLTNMVTVEYAPKLGHIYSDPLSFEAANLNGNLNLIKSTNPATVIKKEKTSQSFNSLQIEAEKTEILLTKNTNEQTNNTVALNKGNEAIHKKPDMNTNADKLNSNRSSVLENISNLSSDWLDSEPKCNDSNNPPEELNSEIKYIEHEGHTTKPISVQKTNMYTKLAVGTNDLNPINEQNRTFVNALETSTFSKVKSLLRKKKSSKREIFTPQKILLKILRSAAGSQEYQNISKKPCSGYDYDITICRYFGKRYLCGYNKNVGDLKESGEIKDLGNGCRMRGDRVECGYKYGPFDNGDTHHNSHGENVQKLIMLNPASSLDRNKNANRQFSVSQTVHESNHAQSTQAIQTLEPATTSHIGKLENTKIPYYSSEKINVAQTKKACAEKDDRLICYDIPA